MASVAGGPTLCIGGTASALSYLNSSYTASNAFDGTSNFWVSAPFVPPDQWIQYLFSSAVTLAEIRLKSRPDGYGNAETAVSWELQSSVDGVDFTRVQAYMSMAWTTASQVQTFVVPAGGGDSGGGGSGGGVSNAYVDQAQLEILGASRPSARVSQSRLEVLGVTRPAALISQSFVEALYRPASNTPQPPRKRVFVAMT